MALPPSSLKGQELEALLSYDGPVNRVEKGEFPDMPVGSSTWRKMNAARRGNGKAASNGLAWVVKAALMEKQGASIREIAKQVNRAPRTIRDRLAERKQAKENAG